MNRLVEDLKAQREGLLALGFWALLVYRFGHARFMIRNKYLRAPWTLVYVILNKLVEILCGITIGSTAVIGRRFSIEHHGCIVIHGAAVIGDDCLIRHGVTLGNSGYDDPLGAPHLGNRVQMGAGAKILGRVTVGDDVIIGANAVVVRDIADGEIVGGVPGAPAQATPAAPGVTSMLFNSYAFLLGFFPATFAVFFLLGRFNREYAAAWLAVASLFFYGYWSLAALPLLIGSICFNYWFGRRITPAGDAQARRRLEMIVAVTVNLAVLGYFKYVNFFIDNLDLALRSASVGEVRALNVVLPIGISFFTFTQIAFLVDCYEGKVRERNFVHYLLFVSYFPHLISGPVLHHSQMMPQFRRPETYRLQENNLVTGLYNVTVGLAKKALLADEFSQYASPIFNAARDGHDMGFIVAWTGALAYTLQIYFDFSGYTDMAIGLSRMLGIQLPLNFDSPYKSTSIIEFWRRWHMTLSQFLRDYLYFRLGGNRHGAARRYANLMTTMILGGTVAWRQLDVRRVGSAAW